MRNYFLLLGLFISQVSLLYAQPPAIASYTKKTYMIPMRDGTKLFTVVLSPTGYDKPVPFLIQRTPYGADLPIREDSAIATDQLPGYYRSMAKEGYILVYQDMRGKFRSEGIFEMNRPVYHKKDKTKTDESTDAFDTIDWLIKKYF